MSVVITDLPVGAAEAGSTERPERPQPLRGGWRIVASKELGDHVRSVRFLLLLLVVGLAGLSAVSTSAGNINDAVGAGPKSSSLFLFLFTGVPSSVSSSSSLPSFVTFLGILGPLLGLAFGFDAITGERARRTLPRLVSQPIFRDDVIKGKFAAGLAAIGLVLGSLMMAVTGLGMLQLGLIPSLADLMRVVAFGLLAMLYIGVWLVLSILLSVRFREGATAALTAIAIWMVFTLFLGLITGAIADRVHKISADQLTQPDVYAAQAYDNAQLRNSLERVSPARLFDDAASVILNPYARTTDSFVDPVKADRAVPSPLPLSESLVIAWTQLAWLAGVGVVLFVAAFVSFLRQEVRA